MESKNAQYYIIIIALPTSLPRISLTKGQVIKFESATTFLNETQA